MVPLISGHYYYYGDNGNGYMKILDTDFKPIFTVTGFMSRHQLRLLYDIVPNRLTFTYFSSSSEAKSRKNVFRARRLQRGPSGTPTAGRPSAGRGWGIGSRLDRLMSTPRATTVNGSTNHSRA